MATVGSPKKLKNPMKVNTGYWDAGIIALANQPANNTKLSDNIFPMFGKLNEAGMITSTVVSDCEVVSSLDCISFLLFSASTGNTTKMFPVAKAVISAVRTG